MPLTSMMPMLLRAPAPGPVASTSGKCPTTVAPVVIRIGRSRVAEALELRREHEVDEDRRQQERSEEFAPLGAQLARLARVVDREALRQHRLRLRLEKAERLVERHRRRNDALNADGIQLLEFL